MKPEDVSTYWKKAQKATFVHCPFCGATQVADNAFWWGVRCHNCGATGPSHPTMEVSRARGYLAAQNEFDPIAAWNKRAEPSPDARLTAALGECALLTEACKELDAELAALRKLREACEAVRAGVQDGMMWMEYSEQAAMLANKRWARWREALAACDEASAPTEEQP